MYLSAALVFRGGREWGAPAPVKIIMGGLALLKLSVAVCEIL